MSLSFFESGIQEHLSWVVLAQELSWGHSNDVRRNCNHLKSWQSTSKMVHSEANHVDLFSWHESWLPSDQRERVKRKSRDLSDFISKIAHTSALFYSLGVSCQVEPTLKGWEIRLYLLKGRVSRTVWTYHYTYSWCISANHSYHTVLNIAVTNIWWINLKKWVL